MKTSSVISLLAVSITTCSATSPQQRCSQLNKLVTVAKVQQQAKAFCEAFIPGTTTTIISSTTTISIVANPTPTTEVVDTSTVTPDASTVTRNLCTEIALHKRRLPSAKDIPQPGKRSLVHGADDFLEPRSPQTTSANYKILGTSRDKRPTIWRLFSASALIEACDCLHYGGTTSTTTTTSTLTSFSTSAQSTTTTTTTVTAPTPTVTSTTNFRLIDSNSNTLYLPSGDFLWRYTSPPSGFQAYSLRDTTVFSNSGDLLNQNGPGYTYAQFNNGPGYVYTALRCSLTSTLELQCLGLGDARVYFYEGDDAYGKHILLSTDEGDGAVTVQAVPDGCT